MLVTTPIAFRVSKKLRMAIIPPQARSPSPRDWRSGINPIPLALMTTSCRCLTVTGLTEFALSRLAAFPEFNARNQFVQYGMTIATRLFSLFYLLMGSTLQTRSTTVSTGGLRCGARAGACRAAAERRARHVFSLGIQAHHSRCRSQTAGRSLAHRTEETAWQRAGACIASTRTLPVTSSRRW
jgi:hypothetical protein